MLNFVLFFVAVIAALILGTKTKVNMGVWAYMFAFVLGIFCCNGTAASVIKNFPTSNFYMFLAAAMFYAFGQMNGTINLMARKLVYKFRGKTAFGPFILLLIASIISISGSNGTTGLILTGMIYPVAAAMNIDVLPCLVAVHAAAGGFGFLPWTSAGANNYAQFSQFQDPDLAMASTYVATLVAFGILLVGTIVTSIKCGVFKKRETSIADIAEPEDYTPEQKKTLTIIFVSLALIIIPIVLKTFWPNDFTKKLANVFCIQTVWTLGIIVQTLMGLGDLKEVITKKVPWNTIVLVTGMCTLFGLAQSLGVVDILGNFVGSVPKLLVLPCIALSTAVLSFFVSGIVLAPFFAPMIATFAAATGLSPVLLMAAVCAGGGATSISPVSAGGAYLLSGAPDGEIKSKATKGLAKVAILNIPFEFLVWLVIGLFA